MELKVEKKSSLRRNDKDALKKRRFSQPVHVKLDCTPTPVISTYRPSEIVNEDIDPDNSIEVGANPVKLEVEGFSTSPKHNLQSSDLSFQEISSNKGLEDDIKPVTAPLKKPSLSHRSISTQSEDDMFESLFNLRQSASYDVTTNHGIWQKFRGLCRKITVSKQFTFFIMSVILLNMICMGLEHYNQVCIKYFSRL